ncbi:MAG: alpha/beta hydrolase, partial [Pseudomonadota bacterium]
PKSLIEEIYAATIDPARYSRLVQCWESYIKTRKDILSETGDAKNGLVEPHVDTALKIFDRIGRKQQDRTSIDSFLASLPIAALIVDDKFAVVGANEGAEARLQTTSTSRLDDLAVDQLSIDRLRSWMAGHGSTSSSTLLLPCFLGPEADSSCIAASAIDLDRLSVASEDPVISRNRDFFLLLTVDFHFDEDLGTALCQAFQLSPAETSVAMALAEGARPATIASERDVSLYTVRTQVKAIQGKMGASAVPDIVRMINGFAATVSASRSLVDGASIEPATQPIRSERVIKLRDGRRLAYKESGDPLGRPVLFIHNMLLGPDLTDEAVAAAQRRGWRLIAPSRPGFGGSDPAAKAADGQLIMSFVDDMEALLDGLKIERAIVVGHLSGAVPALHLADHRPERMRALLMLNYVPVDYSRHLMALPAWQRAFGMTIRYAPQLLPFLARAGAAHIDAGYEEQLLHNLHRDISADMTALACQDVRRAAVQGLRHTVQQGPAAFCRDCTFLFRDWRHEARRLRMPAHLLLGEGDRFVQPGYGRDFVANHPRFGLTVVDDAGMYLLYTHWTEVFDRLERLWTS